MNAKLSQQMSLLGLAAILFYALLLSLDLVSLEVLPQFAVSALIFFTSGRLLRKSAAQDEDEEEAVKSPTAETDWDWLGLLLNWSMSILSLSVLALWLMKPLGLDVVQAFKQSSAHESFFSGYVP
jgi:uncharacterized membrane protein